MVRRKSWLGFDNLSKADGVFNIDAFYVEYRDADDLLYGHDLEMSMEADQTYGFGLQGSLEADDGDKVMPLNIQMEMGVDYSVNNAESTVLYTEPSDIFQQLSALEGGDDLGWEVTDPNNNDDDVWWSELDSDRFSCSWESCMRNTSVIINTMITTNTTHTVNIICI